MTTKQEAAIRRHGEQLLAIFPNATERDSVKLCKKLRTLEKKAARIGLQLCNGPELSYEDADEQTDRILARVNALLGNDEVPVFINRDPRGYALKIDDAWLRAQRADHRTAFKASIIQDWGGYGILAPEINA